MFIKKIFVCSFFIVMVTNSRSQIIPGEMITIPAGEFIMGNNKGDLDQKPERTVYLSAYQIGKYEVTRGEFRKFMKAGGYSNRIYWSEEGWKWKESNYIIYAGMHGKVDSVIRPDKDKKRTEPQYWKAEQEWKGHSYGHPKFIQTDNHPVVGVTWYEAEAYCKWAGGGFRVNQIAPVGSCPAGASPHGCMDMVGNAYEWCGDWAKSYPGCVKPYDYTGLYHVVKGGCWDDPEANTTFRTWYLSPGSAGVGGDDSDIIGFRMAR